MSLKNKLKQKELSIGSWLTIGHPNIVEIMANAGFEWLAIDLEHTSIDLSMTQILITAIQAKGMKALVRVSKNEEVIIKKVLDSGADGIIVPMVNSLSDLNLAVSYAYYPPIGNRGVGLYRAQNYGYSFNEYKDTLSEKLILIAQIEHIDAVSNIDSILSHNYLDAIIIGPYDLSGSMGFPGEYNRDDVKEALEKVKKSCKKHNKSLGFHIIESKADKINEKIDEGYNFLAFSTDFFFLGDKAIKEMKDVKK